MSILENEERDVVAPLSPEGEKDQAGQQEGGNKHDKRGVCRLVPLGVVEDLGGLRVGNTTMWGHFLILAPLITKTEPA